MKILLKLLLLLTCLQNPSMAETLYLLDKDSSRLTFESQLDDIPFTGTFNHYTGRLTTTNDTTQPIKINSIQLTFNLKSVDTEQTERDEALTEPPFFDTKNHPTATFNSHTTHPIKNNKLKIEGILSINNIKQPLTITADIKVDNAITLTGTSRINRLDFNVGTGEFADTEVIPSVVIITFEQQWKINK